MLRQTCILLVFAAAAVASMATSTGSHCMGRGLEATAETWGTDFLPQDAPIQRDFRLRLNNPDKDEMETLMTVSFDVRPLDGPACDLNVTLSPLTEVQSAAMANWTLSYNREERRYEVVDGPIIHTWEEVIELPFDADYRLEVDALVAEGDQPCAVELDLSLWVADLKREDCVPAECTEMQILWLD